MKMTVDECSIILLNSDSRTIDHYNAAKYAIEMMRAYQMIMLDYGIKLKREDPKQVNYIGDGYADGKMVYDQAECPECGFVYDESDWIWQEPYCPHCGQRLVWEVNDGDND